MNTLVNAFEELCNMTCSLVLWMLGVSREELEGGEDRE